MEEEKGNGSARMEEEEVKEKTLQISKTGLLF